jgi:outer membrane immunogenic protein
MRGQFFSCRASVGAASAADLPMKGVPYAAPPPVFGWTGFHIGGHAGAGVLLDRGFRSQGSLLNGPEALADRHGISGLAGGQIGYNWQMGMFVLGIEGESFWSGAICGWFMCPLRNRISVLRLRRTLGLRGSSKFS